MSYKKRPFRRWSHEEKCRHRWRHTNGFGRGKGDIRRCSICRKEMLFGNRKPSGNTSQDSKHRTRKDNKTRKRTLQHEMQYKYNKDGTT
jgi:hypothetical protein